MIGLSENRQLERLLTVTDEVGIVQHSKGAIPDLNHGYSIDDVARELVVFSRAYPDFDDKGKHKVCLDYIIKAERTDGFFHNFYETIDGKWQYRQEGQEELGDCMGRVIWALSEFCSSRYPQEEREKAEEMLNRKFELATTLKPLRSRAKSLLGMSYHLKRKENDFAREGAKILAKSINIDYQQHSGDDWKWYEDVITYCNAKIPLSMIMAGDVLGQQSTLDIGLESLDFLINNSFRNHNGRKTFFAIGNKGWFKIGERPALFDEQTVEAGDMIEACVDAYKITFNRTYKDTAEIAFEWFHGRNRLGINMIDPVSNGVYDALVENGVNTNQGAESILSYTLALTKLREL